LSSTEAEYDDEYSDDRFNNVAARFQCIAAFRTSLMNTSSRVGVIRLN
jgi:hypothetical protein